MVWVADHRDGRAEGHGREAQEGWESPFGADVVSRGDWR